MLSKVAMLCKHAWLWANILLYSLHLHRVAFITALLKVVLNVLQLLPSTMRKARFSSPHGVYSVYPANISYVAGDGNTDLGC